MSKAPHLHVDIAIKETDWLESLADARALTESAAQAAWKKIHSEAGVEGVTDVEASFVLLDDGAQQALNRDYRQQDKPTNVLSFAAGEGPEANGAPRLLGDVTIALQTVRREATAQDKELSSHFSHLVVHGMLHLVGFDHENATDAAKMESLEREILEGIGVSDPYSSRPMPQ